MPLDDQQLARASRLIRRAANLRQADLPTSRFVTQEIEAGRAGSLRLGDIRTHFAALDAKARLTVWWNGATLDRLIDRAHAQIVEVAAGLLPNHGFRVITEFTFSQYGERGSNDVFAGNEAARAIFVGEAKSEWGSMEETLRRQDLKVRLAPRLAKEAFGWRPASTASVLLLPRDRSAQRIAERHRSSLARYSARARELRAWLRRPAGDIGGIWFVSNAALARHESSESSR